MINDTIDDNETLKNALQIFWTNYNLLQFLNDKCLFFAFTSDVEKITDLKSKDDTNEQLRQLLDLADESVHNILKILFKENLSIPDVGYEFEKDGIVIGEAELAWIDKNLYLIHNQEQQLIDFIENNNINFITTSEENWEEKIISILKF